MQHTKKIRIVLSVLLFFSICLIGVAQSTSETIEIGYIVFAPDSVIFENGIEAKELLDQYTKIIGEISSNEKQIHINGYTAIFNNGIDPIKLSADRANVVLNELLSRGISSERFDITKGIGETSNWGNNNASENRRPNRRVTISIDKYKEAALPPSVESSVNNTKENKPSSIIDWKKVALVVGIIVGVAVLIFFGVRFGSKIPNTLRSGGSSMPKSKAESIPKPQSTHVNTKLKKGGYFGELKQQIQKTGQDGTKAVHHMPSDSSLYVAKKLDRGSAPAIIMEATDHVETASYGNSAEAAAYQTKQLDLINAGKFDEAFQMDIDDLKELGLYEKYKLAINEMLEYIKVLKNEGRL